MPFSKIYAVVATAALLCVADKAICQVNTVEGRVNALLAKMTLEEKVGQLNQYNGNWEATGPVSQVGDKIAAVKAGRVGAVLNIMGTAHVKAFQDAAMQSRLKIPLLFGQDVIHGYSITFPIPLAQAASWDVEAIERAERVAAIESAASGINWTFSPMVDIARDPRWGRVMEGAGEDPFLGSKIAVARVKGFQGKGLGAPDAIMACAKHFVAYGAAIGGRDYNSVDMSLHSLWETYLPPFYAAQQAGVATFMNSFNDLNGIPASGSSYLQRDILKGKWNFKGFIVSDWGSIGEMVSHGYVKDNYEAAAVAIQAGSDMDMESGSYIGHLQQLVADKKVDVRLIDDAVRRILTKKFELGLFENPYRFIDAQREQTLLYTPENLAVAREVARKSIVLLKNDQHLLPITPGKSIGLIGPLVKAKKELKGFWSLNVNPGEDIPSLMDGLQAQLPDAQLLYARGCGITDSSRAGFDEAVTVARQSDVVIMAVGEAPDMTGEAKSRSSIHLPGIQEELVKAIVATGKPVVLVLMAGRPIVFDWASEHVPTIVYAWWLGSQGGNAMADVLLGKYNPSAKLPMTFPRSEGQIPIYYNHYSTGRPPASDTDRFYKSAYTDLLNSPRYAFGHGLSYTSFAYSDLKWEITGKENIKVSFQVKNTGGYAGEETSQLYIHNIVSRPLRPVKELKGFKKVFLQPGETKAVTIVFTKEELCSYNEKLEKVVLPVACQIMIGSASDDIRLQTATINNIFSEPL
ncbi:glycoside hydrolase family 3 N-terminal domain-containing protein [Chitinophaga eiseniae]|uniref:beta-glucosidase n=1 Tax=Chitinophaga eiseniae TaxID=634771 RepID=A0A847SGE2_9BACT|nr:glycoside hydrolase family 3 N-terminal domain-containing protein [Chitinophaga eiseniae]NLR82320.1 glycosyl hydrolase [Chitinophaga eiseniae]